MTQQISMASAVWSYSETAHSEGNDQDQVHTISNELRWIVVMNNVVFFFQN